MHFKVRQHIRRAEEQRTVVTIDDPQRFVIFYMENLRKTNRKSYMQFDRFPILFSECLARNCGEISAAMQPDGIPVAMTFLVWDDQTMYYLMCTRDTAVRDNGSVNLLVWSAIKRAHELGLIFDLDGVSNGGTARFLSGFGGAIKTRLIISKGQPVYNVVQSVKTILRGGRLFNRLLAQAAASVAPAANDWASISHVLLQAGLFSLASSCSADATPRPRPGTMTRSAPRNLLRLGRCPRRTVATSNGKARPAVLLIWLAVAHDVVGDGCARSQAALDFNDRHFDHVKKSSINVIFDTSSFATESQ